MIAASLVLSFLASETPLTLNLRKTRKEALKEVCLLPIDSRTLTLRPVPLLLGMGAIPIAEGEGMPGNLSHLSFHPYWPAGGPTNLSEG